MPSDMTRDDFILVLDYHDDLVRQVASGALVFDEFVSLYDNFYDAFSLDGHESDEAELQLFAGRTIVVPSLFLSGKSVWGVYQRAGSLDGMKRACTKFDGVELVDGAGHWVQQEQSAKVADRLVSFGRQHS